MESLPISERRTLVKSKLVDGLIKFGFDLYKEEEISATELLGEVYEYWFSNENKIEISVSYSPKSSGCDYFTLFIYNKDCQEDFSLDDWLKKHNSKSLSDPFKLESYNGTFIEKLNGFFNYLELIFTDTKMASTLSGDAWENVEFDWGGMR